MRVLMIATLMCASLVARESRQPVATERNDPNEPIAEVYDFGSAVAFLDRSSAAWETQRNCVTCHTNGMSMLARSALGPDEDLAASMAFARGYLDTYLVDGEEPSGQHGSIEGLAATTAFLSIAETNLEQPPSPAVLRGFDHLWETQDPSGIWTEWLKCNWPPYESDDHFGATLVAMAAAGLPGEALRTDRASAGFERLTAYLQRTGPKNLHQRAMLLWASSRVVDLIEPRQHDAIVAELLEAQFESGGWSMASLADETWTHDSGEPQESGAGPYATALAVVVLDAAEAGRDAADAGRAWLREHQRSSGRWFNRSPRRDRHHYISHAASALAVLALREDAQGLSQE